MGTVNALRQRFWREIYETLEENRMPKKKKKKKR
jgi:hypothetical protein